MPVWYSLDEDGSLIDRRAGNWYEVLNLSNQMGYEVYPSIALFDADQMEKALSSDANIDRTVSQLMADVEKYNLEGVDIDYEMIYLSDSNGYFKFLNRLKEALGDRVLSVTVLPQWETLSYSNLTETRAVQDWVRIGELADQVRIMTYDYTYSGSTSAGPIGPLGWQEGVLQYAVKRIPKEKIWLGVHLYAYSWAQGSSATALTFSAVESIDESLVESRLYNIGFAEEEIIYRCDTDINCIAMTQTHEGIDARAQLASDYGIAGLAFWRLGNEGTLLNDSKLDRYMK